MQILPRTPAEHVVVSRNSDMFALPSAGRRPATRAVMSWLTRPLVSWTRLDVLRGVYEQIPPTETTREFYDQALRALQVQWRVSEGDLQRIPATGPVAIVANHPFGAVEGLILGAILLGVRPDFKFMANYLLARLPELREAIIAVDPFGGTQAGRRNLAPLRECLKWLRAGGALGVFPAGEVAHLQFRRRVGVTDPAWNPNVAALIQRAGVPVLPVYFEGRNSVLFHMLGLLHPRLRTVMLGRELANKRQHTIHVRIGTLIPAERLAQFTEPRELSAYLRFRTFVLKHRPAPAAPSSAGRPARLGITSRPAAAPLAILPAMPPELLQEEVASLNAVNRLQETDELAVYVATAGEIPEILREIGRLRELTFRLVGEGTGRAIDLDRFDQHYSHLFIWHKLKQEVVGAYRVGKVDRILSTQGVGGLYTQTLFRYSPRQLADLGPALELGRSFIRPEYQRSFSPLLLLWRGIGEMVNREPQYRRLLGPVSISNNYQAMSRQLLAAFLNLNHRECRNGQLARARHPLRLHASADIQPTADAARLVSLDEASALIAELEPDRKGIPVLLRQYLKLGGVILGLNVDPTFGNVLDGLVLVDLVRTEPRLLEKYLGKPGAANFLALHGASLQTQAL